MKQLIVVAIVLVLVALATNGNATISGEEGPHFTIRIESASSDHQAVSFSGSYASYSKDSHPELKFIVERTPFELTTQGEFYLGMFQTHSTDQLLKVTLTKYGQSGLEGHATGSGKLNFVHGEPDGVGYGVPPSSKWSHSMNGQR